MRDHGPSIKPRAVFLVILVVSLVAVDAIGPGRTASAWAAPTRRGIGHRAPGSPGSSLRRVERHLDSSRWGWREARIKVRIGFHPGDCCHRGIFDFPNRTMWIGPSAFRTDRLLRTSFSTSSPTAGSRSPRAGRPSGPTCAGGDARASPPSKRSPTASPHSGVQAAVTTGTSPRRQGPRRPPSGQRLGLSRSSRPCRTSMPLNGLCARPWEVLCPVTPPGRSSRS